MRTITPDRTKAALYSQALNPPRTLVSADEFDQIVYDAIHRDKTQPPAAIQRWAHRHYEIVAAVERDGMDRVVRMDPPNPNVSDVDNGSTAPSGIGPDVKRGSNPDGHKSRAYSVFHQQNGDVTKAYYADLCAIGPLGVIAMNLFRSMKRSSRAKDYKRGKFRRAAYDVKQYSIEELCKALAKHGQAFGIQYGWKEDPAVVFGNEPSHVLYVQIPQGQVSFHSPTRGLGPDYEGEWDGIRGTSESRIIEFCDQVEHGGKV